MRNQRIAGRSELGLRVRDDDRPLDWWVAYVNNREGEPALAQPVVSRRSRHDAAIEHPQLLPGTSDLDGWSLLDVAIQHAARRGMHRLPSPSGLQHVQPFALTKHELLNVVFRNIRRMFERLAWRGYAGTLLLEDAWRARRTRQFRRPRRRGREAAAPSAAAAASQPTQ